MFFQVDEGGRVSITRMVPRDCFVVVRADDDLEQEMVAPQ